MNKKGSHEEGDWVSMEWIKWNTSIIGILDAIQEVDIHFLSPKLSLESLEIMRIIESEDI